MTTKNLPHRLFCFWGQSFIIKSWAEVLLKRNFTPKQGRQAAAKYVNLLQFPYSYGTFFMRLWATYIFPDSVHNIFLQQNRQTDPGNIHIKRSKTRECGNWEWGRTIPFLEIFCFEFSVMCLCSLASADSLHSNYEYSESSSALKTYLVKSPRVPSQLHATKLLWTACRGHVWIGS